MTVLDSALVKELTITHISFVVMRQVRDVVY
jgi:hypothetical protein